VTVSLGSLRGGIKLYCRGELIFAKLNCRTTGNGDGKLSRGKRAPRASSHVFKSCSISTDQIRQLVARSACERFDTSLQTRLSHCLGKHPSGSAMRLRLHR
jgi:hypothetical protein